MGNFQDGGEKRSFLVEMLVKTDVVTQVLFINCEFHSNTGEAKWFSFNSVSLFFQKVVKKALLLRLLYRQKFNVFACAERSARGK